MENSNITKQAKSDIFKELHPIVKFYINKGAKPNALKKYYKNNKRFSDLLEDIKKKGSDLVKDEKEYEKLVRNILHEMLDDFIAKEKDEEYKNKKSKMKHLKEFNHFEIINEYDEYDDSFSLDSLHRRRLKSFQDRLDKIETEEDLLDLTEDAEEYERYTDLENLESEWSDFMVYLGRKREQMLLVTFKNEDLNEFVERLKKLKTKSDLDSLLKDLDMFQRLAQNSGDNELHKELKEFLELLNNNDNAMEIFKQK